MACHQPSEPKLPTRVSPPFASRRLFLAGVAGLIAGAAAPQSDVWADTAAGDSSNRSRDEAMRAMPLSRLTEEGQRKVLSVLESPTIYRRLPDRTAECDSDLFLNLVRNPEVIVNIWEVMGVSQMTCERIGPFAWRGNDGAGTQCRVELVYGSENLHLYYGDGFYEGSLLKRKTTGRAVMLLRSTYQVGRDAKSYIANRLDFFLTLDNIGADLLAKTIFPLVGSNTDANFEESTKFISKLSQTAERNGPGMQRLADKLTRLSPEVRDSFAEAACTVQQRSALRAADTRLR